LDGTTSRAARAQSIAKRSPLRPERIASFSALNRALHRESQAEVALGESEPSDARADDGEAAQRKAAEAEPVDSLPSIFTLPKGAEAGDLLHLILERFDFSKPSDIGSIVDEAFQLTRFAQSEYKTILEAQTINIADLPLRSHFDRFRLKDIPAAARSAEVEFSYPVQGELGSRLLSALSAAPLGKIPARWCESLRGETAPFYASMMRGYIDLLFEFEGRLYIVDWKSNYLGPSAADYDEAAIQDSMSEHNYYLQYLLYCVALRRHLSWKRPEARFADCFGGVFYIYARGISPGSETGIYYDLPSPELIAALDAALANPTGKRP